MNSRQRTVALLPFLLAVLAISAQAKQFEHWQPETLLSATVASGNAEAVAERIRAGADVNEVDWAGRTALMWSSICKSSSVARVLIQAGARVDLMDKDGYTALAHAVRNAGLQKPPCHTSGVIDAELVRMLIGAGSDVNARKGPDRRTPLHDALNSWIGGGWQSPEIVKVLLDAGADPNVTFGFGTAPVNQVALNVRDFNSDTAINLFKLLIAAGADPNHSRGGDPTPPNSWGPPPPIVSAVDAGQIDFVRYLVNLGVELNTVVVTETDGKRTECTALDVAAEAGRGDIKVLLESAGAVSAAAVGE